MFKIQLPTLVNMILLYCIIPTGALPVGALPKGARTARWTASGSDDDTETETYTTPEQEVYARVMYPYKKSPTAAGGEVDRTIHQKTVTRIIRGKLYNRNRLALRINMNGTVDGTSDDTSPLAELEFHSVGTSLLMIMGLSSQRYLSISDKGVLHGSEDPTLNSVFREVQEENMYHSYLSYKHEKEQWLVAIKRNGKAKKAPQTMVGQKSTQFLIVFSS